MSTEVVKYDVACRAVAACRTLDDVRDWSNKADAIREYARRAKNKSMEIDAAEIRIRAERRRGELIVELKKSGALVEGRKPKKNDTSGSIVSLKELKTTPNESSHAQKLAAPDGNSFERLVKRWRAHQEKDSERVTLNVLKVPEIINGSRALMGSRQEDIDSLDFFPTPPWATRALIERVFPYLDCDTKRRSAWEPACGEGHMAEVLREYFRTVMATDIHKYNNGHSIFDFLKGKISTQGKADWIITNPPFGDKTEAFTLRAIDIAKVGVAMFVRMQWLETIGRYENIFKPFPPTLIAFFAERVNLAKGAWYPDGGTATAYVWLIWLKGKKPRAPFWIPPGCQETLTRNDDAERFGMMVDAETGEIRKCGAGGKGA